MYYYYYFYELENAIKEILTYSGYDVSDFNNIAVTKPVVDWLIKKDGATYSAVIKGSQSIDASLQMIMASINELTKWWMKNGVEANYIPLLIVGGVVKDDVKRKIKANPLTHMIEIWDIRDLLELVRDNIELRKYFVGVLPFSIDQDLLIGDQSIIQSDSETQVLDSLIKQVELWVSPKDKGKTYEKLCEDVLNALFYDDLTKWSKQQPSDGGLFRFDLICKIKNEHNRDFWSMAERFFQTKYIVFEFKDYNEPVTQREVFTTVKYLYPKALRGIAILISATGIDEHGMKAIKGILRDEGKLIIALDNKDLVEMLKLKKKHNPPADYLSDKLDALLIELEK